MLPPTNYSCHFILPFHSFLKIVIIIKRNICKPKESENPWHYEFPKTGEFKDSYSIAGKSDALETERA